MVNLSNRIKNIRERARLKQKEIAEKIGVSIQTIGRWERNERRPDAEELQNLATALDTTVAYLMGETDDPARHALIPTKVKEVLLDQVKDMVRNYIEGEVPMPSDDNLLETFSNEMADYYSKNTGAPIATPKQGIPADLVPLNPRHQTLVRLLPKEFSASCGWGHDWSWNSEAIDFDFQYTDPDPELVRYSPVTGMYVMGDSMEPDIEDGDIVLFTDNPHDIDYASNGSIVIVNYEGRMIVRGLFRKPDSIILKARNKEYEDIVVSGEQELRICGLVLRIDKHNKPRPML
jgi:transcriptional regulator with XRE-family HTH domain/phage repressor protein C with HTH and peptisase S24 domain